MFPFTLSGVEIPPGLIFNMSTATTYEEKRDLILAKEKRFCHEVSAGILDKPQLAIWMILIPVFFVFYFWQLKRYSDGRKDFAANFLITRVRALNSAYEAAINNTEPELEELVHATDVPEQTRDEYRNWLRLLSSHYLELLQSKGESFEELVQSVYRNKKSYSKFYQELKRVEHEFNAKLRPHIDINDSEVADIVTNIEAITAQLRKIEVQEIFS